MLPVIRDFFDLVVIDEASMMDIILTNSLLKAISDKAALILVGDVRRFHGLPNIGDIGAGQVDIAHRLL